LNGDGKIETADAADIHTSAFRLRRADCEVSLRRSTWRNLARACRRFSASSPTVRVRIPIGAPASR